MRECTRKRRYEKKIYEMIKVTVKPVLVWSEASKALLYSFGVYEIASLRKFIKGKYFYYLTEVWKTPIITTMIMQV